MIDPRTDCHCHILPLLDDGSKCMAESVFLARCQVKWGFRRAVCTSHRVGKYPNVPEIVVRTCEGNHILIELPIHKASRIGNIVPEDEIKRLLDMGYQPVLAHPERYLYLDKDRYHSLKEAGALFQRNIGSLEGLYGEAVSVRARALFTEGLYDTQGSDLHNEQYARFFDSFGFHI